MNQSPIIIALDGFSRSEDFDRAIRLSETLKDHVWGFKVNDLFTAWGWSGVSHLTQSGCRVMLDMKFYDIPNTVKNHCEIVKRFGAHIITVHAQGGSAMMKAATEVLPKKVAAVTILTSFNEQAYRDSFLTETSIPEAVVHHAAVAAESGCEYVVCSGEELPYLCEAPIKKIVPAIRPAWYRNPDDQKRAMTPKEAKAAGADLLVIGRPILTAESPLDAVKKTLDELNG